MCNHGFPNNRKLSPSVVTTLKITSRKICNWLTVQNIYTDRYQN